jgi:hypothetical protein
LRQEYNEERAHSCPGSRTMEEMSRETGGEEGLRIRLRVEEQKSGVHNDWESRSSGGEVISAAKHIKRSEVVLRFIARLKRRLVAPPGSFRLRGPPP